MNMERNHGEGDGDFKPSPEQSEQLRVNSIVIPADEDGPLRQHQLAPSGLAERQALVGGDIEGLMIGEPSARLLMNEDGKLLQLPVNRRATLLLWMHNKRLRYRDVLVGDVVVLGYPDEEGVDTSVPDELISRLFSATQLRVETQGHGEAEWNTPSHAPFDNWLDAYDYALHTGFRHHQLIADVRVVPEE